MMYKQAHTADRLLEKSAWHNTCFVTKSSIPLGVKAA
jgi:hypothetical protein